MRVPKPINQFSYCACSNYRFYDEIKGIPEDKKLHESEWMGVLEEDMIEHLKACKINPKTGKKKRVNGKKKGDSYERLVANLLKPLYPKAQRANQDKTENEVCDVEGTPFWIEAKDHKSIAAFRYYDQALQETKAHSDKRPIMVVMKEKRTAKQGALNLAMIDFDLMWILIQFVEQMGHDWGSFEVRAQQLKAHRKATEKAKRKKRGFESKSEVGLDGG